MSLSLQNTLAHFLDYLSDDEKYENLKKNMKLYKFTSDMKAYDKHLAQIKQDFQNIKINNIAISAQIAEILDLMNIHKNKRTRFANVPLTVHDFLLELHQLTEHEKVAEFLRLVEKRIKVKDNTINIIASGAIIAIVLSPVFYAVGGLSLVQSLLAIAIFVPAVSIVFTTLVAAYSLYQNLTAKNKSMFDLFHDNFFLIASTALNVAAYSVLIAAATTVHPVAAILFVVASAVYVVKEAISLVKIVIENRNNGYIVSEDSLEERYHKTRLVNSYSKVRNALIIEFASAVAMVGIIAFWCFVPGGMFVTIAAITAIGIVLLGKEIASSYNESNLKAQLQNDFTRVELDFEAEQAQKNRPLNFDDDLGDDLDREYLIPEQTPDVVVRETRLARVMAHLAAARGGQDLSADRQASSPLIALSVFSHTDNDSEGSASQHSAPKLDAPP